MTTGVVCVPHGAKLVGAVDQVEMLAEIGIIFLLFGVGLELSLSRLLKRKRLFFIGGGVQVSGTLLIGFFVAQCLPRPTGEAIFLGCLLSLSSTAIVLKLLSDAQQTDTPHGRVVLSILIFQDVIAVPMMRSKQ